MVVQIGSLNPITHPVMGYLGFLVPGWIVAVGAAVRPNILNPTDVRHDLGEVLAEVILECNIPTGLRSYHLGPAFTNPTLVKSSPGSPPPAGESALTLDVTKRIPVADLSVR